MRIVLRSPNLYIIHWYVNYVPSIHFTFNFPSTIAITHSLSFLFSMDDWCRHICVRNIIPELLARAAFLFLARTFYSKTVMPSSSSVSIFCLTCPHAVYNKQKKDQLYPVSEKTKEKEQKYKLRYTMSKGSKKHRYCANRSCVQTDFFFSSMHVSTSILSYWYGLPYKGSFHLFHCTTLNIFKCIKQLAQCYFISALFSHPRKKKKLQKKIQMHFTYNIYS